MTSPPDRAPTRVPAPLSRAEFARLAHRSRSTITEAARPGGPLHAARVADRIDRDHPAARAYLARARSARTGGERDAEPDALSLGGCVDIQTFAWLAGVSEDDVLALLDGVLAPAVLADRVLDLKSAAALSYFATRPFRRMGGGEPEIPAGFLFGACIGDDIDLEHPVARVFFTRLEGRVFNDAEYASRTSRGAA